MTGLCFEYKFPLPSTQGVFPEGAIVLAEGCYDEEEVLRVTGIGLPPVESAAETRRYFAVANPFGGGPLNGPAASDDTKMSRLLNASSVGALFALCDSKPSKSPLFANFFLIKDAMVVLLGETRLDSPGCLEKLETIFIGYADFPPAAFVLCGDFISPDYGLYPSDKVCNCVMSSLLVLYK